MSRKTLIYLMACAELCLGTYFMLGFLAWLVRIFFLDPSHSSSPATLVVWAVLAGGCFWLYVVAWRKIKEIDRDKPKAPSIDERAEAEREEEKTAV